MRLRPKRIDPYCFVLIVWIVCAVVTMYIAYRHYQRPLMAEPAAICATGLRWPEYWTCQHMDMLRGNGWKPELTELET